MNVVIIIVIKAEKWNSTYTFSIVYTLFQKHLCHICVNNIYNIHIILYDTMNLITLNFR